MQTATRVGIGLLQAMRHARQARRAPRVAIIALRVGSIKALLRHTLRVGSIKALLRHTLRVGIGLLKRVAIALLKAVRQAGRAARAVRAPRCRRRRV